MAGIWSWDLRIICMLGRLGRGTCAGGRYCLAGVGEWGAYLKESSSTDLGTKHQRTGEIRDNNLLGHFLCTRVRGALRGSKRGRLVPCSLSGTTSPGLVAVRAPEGCEEPPGDAPSGVLRQRSPAHFCSSHACPLQQSTSSRPPISPHFFFLSMYKTCGCPGERGGPRVPSHYFQWLPVDNWGWGRGKAHGPETGSRQGGD